MMPAPFRFIGTVMLLWIGARMAVLLPGASEALAPAPAALRLLLGVPAVAAVPTVRRPSERVLVATVAGAYRRIAPVRGAAPAVSPVPPVVRVEQEGYSLADRALLVAYMNPRGRLGAPQPLSPGFEAAMAAGPVPRWSGDVHLLVRDGDAAGLAPGAQLGGGQVFARLSYRLDDIGRLAATARVSRALGARQTEAAVGLRRSVAPGMAVTVERRIALDAGGRSAWAAFVAGGIDDRAIGPVAIDAYTQAGVVGARRRDGFIDGAARAGRRVGTAKLGLGLWGAAQPGVARLDVGPQMSARLPGGVAAALDWRLRVAGQARPGSGVALTIAAGF